MWHSLTLLFVHCVDLSNKNPKLHFVILTVTFKQIIRRITLFGISFSNQQKQLPPFHPFLKSTAAVSEFKIHLICSCTFSSVNSFFEYVMLLMIPRPWSELAKSAKRYCISKAQVGALIVLVYHLPRTRENHSLQNRHILVFSFLLLYSPWKWVWFF